MNPKFIRIYKKVDIDDIREHLLIYGELSGNCSKCKTIGLKFDLRQCPDCNAEFRYITFRNIKENMPKILKLSETHPGVTFVDYDDYKRITGALKAEDFFS